MSDSEEEEEIRVTRFKHEGVDYLKSAENFLYDPKSSEVVGYWNAETSAVEEAVEYSSEESADEETDEAFYARNTEFYEETDEETDEETEDDREFIKMMTKEPEPPKPERTPAQLAATQKFGDDMIAGFLAEALAGIGRGKSTQPSVSKPPLPPVLTPEPAPPNTSSEAVVEKKKRCPKGTRRNKKTGDCEPKTATEVTEKQVEPVLPSRPQIQMMLFPDDTDDETGDETFEPDQLYKIPGRAPPIQMTLFPGGLKKEKKPAVKGGLKKAKSVQPDQLLSFADFQAKLNLGKYK